MLIAGGTYCEQHKPLHSWQHRGDRHARGYGKQWDRIRAVVLKRDLYLCQVCANYGRVKPAKQVDHIVPKAQGGTDGFDNLQAICIQCHRVKTAEESNKPERFYGNV